MKYLKAFNESNNNEIDYIMQNLIDDYGFSKPRLLDLIDDDILHTKTGNTIHLNDEEFIKELDRVSKKMEAIGYIMTIQSVDMEGRYNSSIIDKYFHTNFFKKYAMNMSDLKTVISNSSEEQKKYDITYMLFWFTKVTD